MSQPVMVTEVEEYFDKGCGRCARHATPDCSTRKWLAGLLALRRIARDLGLEEVAKWGHPVFMHRGRNIAILGAFRGDFRLSFFNAALMRDPGGLLDRQGPNSRHPDCLRFTSTEGPARLEPQIRAYLAEAMGYAEQGLVPPKEPAEIDLPAELADAMNADPVLAEAFANLTPGRQKSWALHIRAGKAVATRLGRIERARPRILAGKGATDT